MGHHQFINEVIAEPLLTFEKTTKLRKIGVSLNTALRVLCPRRKPNDETSTAKTDILERICDGDANDRSRHLSSDMGDSSSRSN